MKKKAIAIISVVLALAILTVFCINLFGCRTMITNWVNRIRWILDCESLSVKAALHAIVRNTQGTDILDEIIFPKEAYVDTYNSSNLMITDIGNNSQYNNEVSTRYEIHIILPKDQTAAFITALLSAGFTEEYSAQNSKQWDVSQSFGELTNSQLSYVFKRLYGIEHTSSKEYAQRPTTGIACIFLVELEKITEVIIDI